MDCRYIVPKLGHCYAGRCRACERERPIEAAAEILTRIDEKITLLLSHLLR